MADSQSMKRGRPKTPRRWRRIIVSNNINKTNQKHQKQTKFLNSLQLPTSNQFSVLANVDNAMDTSEQTQATKKVYISPVVVTDYKTKIQEMLDASQCGFNLQINSVGRKILPKTAEDKTKIIDLLEKEKINFYTHPENDNKTFKVILSGLPQVEIKYIEDSLKEYNVAPTKVTMFNTQAERKLYLLHFNASEVNRKTLEPIVYVHYHKIKWLPFKPKRNGPTQCMRCLMFGHGIKSCNRYTVCMLCAGSHLTKDCTTHNNTDTKTNTNLQYTCFNCKSANIAHNHKANDANCPFRSKYEEAKKNARSKTTTNNRSQAHTPHFDPATQPPPLNVTFADSLRAAAAAASSSTNTQPSAHTNTSQNNTSSRSNPGGNSNANPSSNLWSIDECANLLFDSIDKLQKCSSKLEQLRVITNLLQHACK